MGRIETEHDNFPTPEPEFAEGDTQPYEVAPGYADQLPPFMAQRGYAVSAPPFADPTPMPDYRRAAIEWQLQRDGLLFGPIPPPPGDMPQVMRRSLRQRLVAAFHAFRVELRREEEWQL